MANAVRYIRAIGIYGRFDLELDFRPGVNILHGKNGTGKTTLLHILANVLNGDFERFVFLPFATIEVHLDDKQRIKLRQYTHSDGNKIDVHVNGKEVASFSVPELKKELALRTSGQWISSTGHVTLSPSPSPPLRRRRTLLSTAYFPAFRTLIEASTEEESSLYDTYGAVYISGVRVPSSTNTIGPTEFARRFFGDFVPILNYPSPLQVSKRLSTEMQKALNDIADTDRKLLSKAFLDIFATLSKESNPAVDQLEYILEKIRTLLEDTSIIIDPSVSEEVYSQLRELVLSFKVRPGREDTYVPILEVYKNSLEERADVQKKSLLIINTYLDSVNRFFDDKKLALTKASASELPILQVRFDNGGHYSKIQALSSGERQIVTLLYSVTHLSGQKVVLIDEPEISLHIDWQSSLIPEMVAQLHDRQIITCTHSPMIGAEYEDQMIELEIKPTSQNSGPSENVAEETEDNL